ncbi:uncharacterized protein LY89DRAFT_680304 [Mollisia scopiformis]|uniref:Velvet domain-containing protein n=1 Tax=Mollisia scopiformis TaxID=149040 RepID=A0A194XTV5_MOLSC|nr:uncharacterized protein LY89DRAFT_680304 [Mollisia scopiformis]KUJ23571.1 hypothetical protein LY89DRAFT_680304 [Mollisia scopiformis]
MALPNLLSGQMVDSAHPLDLICERSTSDSSNSIAAEAQDRAYFYFSGLAVTDVGHYRLRVTLMQMDYVSCPKSAPDGETIED